MRPTRGGEESATAAEESRGRAALDKLKARMTKRAAVAEPEPEYEAEEEEAKETLGEHCVVDEAVARGITRQLNMFKITAYVGKGELQPNGGDVFSVSIRGRGERVRAKIIDNEDGTYNVGFKPTTSGRYLIWVSHGSTQLPGSPFTCIVSTPSPSAPSCELRGPALTSATARKEEFFEVSFRDALGQTAHAEELDVYVTQLTPKELAELDAADSVVAEEEAPEEKPDVSAERLRPSSPPPATGTAGTGGGTGGGGERLKQPRSPPSSRPASAAGFIPLLKTRECTVTSKKPLVLRSGLGLDTDKVGQLQPGQRVKLLEVDEVIEDGQRTVRASVTLVDDDAHAPSSPQASPKAARGEGSVSLRGEPGCVRLLECIAHGYRRAHRRPSPPAHLPTDEPTHTACCSCSP
jgi:hypothetical protein